MKRCAKTLIKHEKLSKDSLSKREKHVQRSTNHYKWLKSETQTARSFESSPSVAWVNSGSSYDALNGRAAAGTEMLPAA